MEGIYILHYDYPFRIPGKFQYGDCTHYVGKSHKLYQRLNHHKWTKTKGSKKTQLGNQLDISYTAFIFDVEASYANEAMYTKHVREYCPMCSDVLDPTYNHKATLGVNKNSQMLRFLGEGSSLECAGMVPASETAYLEGRGPGCQGRRAFAPGASDCLDVWGCPDVK